MKHKKSEQKSKPKIELPDRFQEKLIDNELKYELGERSSVLLKEMTSLYQLATEYYISRKNKVLTEFFRQKYQKLLEKPDTLAILYESNDKLTNIESTRSSDKNKQKSTRRGSKAEEKLLTLNDTVMGKDYFALGKFKSKEFNTYSGGNRPAITTKNMRNQRILTNSDETTLYGCAEILNKTKTMKGVVPSLFATDRLKYDLKKVNEVGQQNDLEKNYKSNDSIFKNNPNDCTFVSKAFRKIENQQLNQRLENQINSILGKLSRSDEKFENALNNDIDHQREKFLEMKNFKKEEQLTQTQKIKKFLTRRGSQFDEIYKSLMEGEKSISQEDIVTEIISFIEKQLLISNTQMNREIEEFISKNIKEMKAAIQELEANYMEDIKKFEESGDVYADVISNLRNEMQEEIKQIKLRYEENRADEIKKIKTNYLKNV